MSFARGGSSPPIRTNLEMMSYSVYDVGILMQNDLVCRDLSSFKKIFFSWFS